MDFGHRKLTRCLYRFSQLISSTQPQPLRLASTSSRYAPIAFSGFLYIGVVVNLTLPLIDPCPCSPLLLHGRQVPRLLHHHHRLLPRTNRCHLRWLLDCALPTNRWKGPLDRRLLLPKKVDVPPALLCFLCRVSPLMHVTSVTINHES